MSDYAREVLGDPWDMNSITDVSRYVTVADFQATTLQVNNGLLNIAMTGNSSYFYLLSPGFCGSAHVGKTGHGFPIDTSKYRYLVLRMFSERNAQMRVQVNFACNPFSDFFHSVSIPTVDRWNTYIIDLATVGRANSLGNAPAWGSAPATGLRIDPATDGTPVLIDWVMLTAEPPADRHTLDYTFTQSSNSLHTMMVDTDVDPANGTSDVLAVSAASTQALQISPAKLFPGQYRALGVEGHDFASLNLDPWDMENSDDFAAPAGMNVSITNGVLNGVTTDEFFFIVLNNFSSTIDASRFRYLRLDISIDQEDPLLVHYFRPDGSLQGTADRLLSAGRQTLDIDLGAQGSWNGSISAIQLAFRGGVTFALHDASLRTDGFGPSEVITPDVSPATLRVNSPPILKILQPDNLGGIDFATAVLGNPWNMDNAADIERTTNVENASILPGSTIGGVFGNFFQATNTLAGDRDPVQESLRAISQPNRQIDASRYRNLSYRLRIDRTQDINEGSVVRVIWHRAPDNILSAFNSEDIIAQDGWNTYVQDMTTLHLEAENHPDGSFTGTPWSGLVDLLRVDAHEFLQPTTFAFDYIRLTADDEANTKFAITFTVEDEDTDLEDIQVNFYHSPTASTSGGTLIGSVNPATSNILAWDTAALPAGTYYVIGEVNDGLNSSRVLANGRLVVTRDRAQDSTPPVLVVENPSSGATLFDSVNLAGYALDSVQLAGVEVLIDGNRKAFIKPELFHAAAYALYPNETEGSNAGFLSSLDLSDVTAGAHTLQLIAYDTGGNSTSSAVIPFTKAGGTDPTPFTPTPPAEQTPVDVTSPAEPENPVSLSVVVNSKIRRVILQVGQAANCTSLRVVGGPSEASVTARDSNSVTFRSKRGKNTVTFRAVGVRGLKKTLDGPALYFGAYCDGELSSAVKRISRPGIKQKPINGTLAWLKHLNSKLK
jgi:hypothetical protein